MNNVETILSICGAISIIGGAGTIVWKIIHPTMKIVKKVKTLEKRLDNDNTLLAKMSSLNRVQSLALLSMINHMIDGNGIDKLKDMRDKLQTELMENNVY